MAHGPRPRTAPAVSVHPSAAVEALEKRVLLSAGGANSDLTALSPLSVIKKTEKTPDPFGDAVHATAETVNGLKAAKAKGQNKKAWGLESLGDAYEAARSPETDGSGGTGTSGGTSPAFQPADPLLRVAGDRVAVEAYATGNGKTLLGDLQSLGLVGGTRHGRAVTGWLPMASLGALDSVGSLRFARPLWVKASAGAVTSQGDAALWADVARPTHGLDGSGVKVGILSDSFDTSPYTPIHYANDAAGGDLPGNVQVLSDSPGGTDEGRALAQIVHDTAPGASLAFATAYGGQDAFAANVRALRDAGADVIVDDVTYLAEPMFQDGPVAQAVDEVVASGVPYFAAAGNWGRQGYESGFRPGPLLADGAIPSGWGAPSFFGGAAHDFDPGAGVDALQSFTLEPGQGVILSLQWDQPFYSVGGGAGSASDVDVYVLDASGTRVLGGSTTDNVGGDPVEVFGFANDSGATESYNLMIVTRSGPAPGRMKYVNFQPLGAGQGFTEWDTNSGTLFGHANAAGAVAVGAAGWYETPRAGVDPARVQSYSSTGDTPILFDPAGNRLPAPAARPGPRLTGPDGVDTTFFGQPADDGTGYLNFFGTSAAAPAVAAAAALMRQARPAMSPQQVYATLGQTAADMDDPATPGFDAGHDAATGYGLVRADEAVRLAATAPTARVTINDGSAQRSMVTSVTVTFDRAVTLGPAAFSLARPGGTAVGLAAGNPSGDGHTYVLTFDPSQTTGGSLDDGVYELTVGASSALDVTGRGLAADARQTFTRLFGDVNGDAGVNGLDYAAFGRAYGRVAGDPQYVWYLDYDANGGINGLDYYQFGRRYGTTLP